MRSTSTLMFLAAWGVGSAIAGPTLAHLHRNAHEKRHANPDDWSTLDWNKMGVDWKSAYEAGQHSATAAVNGASATNSASSKSATTPKPSTTTSSDSSSSSKESGSGGSDDSLPVVGCSNSRTKFGEQVSSNDAAYVDYMGNYGNPYAANVMMVDDAGSHDYTITAKNTQDKEIVVNLWNKVGSDLQANSGATAAPSDTALTFKLGPGESKTIALQEDSQGALCEVTDNLHQSGAYAITWAEFNMISTGPAYDVSAILNEGSEYQMTISSEEISCQSTPSENSWVTETQKNGGGDCWIQGKSAHLTVEFGG